MFILAYIFILSGIIVWSLLRKDWFKSKAYWLRGGLIGAIIWLISLTLIITCVTIFPGEEGTICLFPPSGFIGVSIYSYSEQLLGRLLHSYDIYDFINSIFSLKIVFGEEPLAFLVYLHTTSFIILFLTGALIGAIVGKIKQK